jgi:hypothetical protein
LLKNQLAAVAVIVNPDSVYEVRFPLAPVKAITTEPWDGVG